MNENTPRQPGSFDGLTYEQLGELLKNLRKLQKLTQEGMAKKTNIAARTIKRIEKGESASRPYYLEDISRALGYELRQSVVYTLVPLPPAESK